MSKINITENNTKINNGKCIEIHTCGTEIESFIYLNITDGYVRLDCITDRIYYINV